jgi:lactate 2-monooxygenase
MLGSRHTHGPPAHGRGAGCPGSCGLTFDGTHVQNAIYVSGECEWPVAPEEWEALARDRIDAGAFDYIAGGAGGESTVRANLEAFERRRLRPRMLAGNAERDLDAPRWFQLYWINDRDVVASLPARATASGYSAVVVTLDTPILGWRPRDLRRSYLPFVTGQGCAQFFSDPVFRSRLAKPPEEDMLTAAATMLSMFPHLQLTWNDLAWFRELTDLPVLVRGVLTAEDARRAVNAGVDGIIVSNHGARQVDGAVASLDAMVEVREALPGTTVLMDGGIRRGADVLKALALGAHAVLVGRPYAYGLAVGGQEGAEAVLRHLWAETDVTLALAGGRSARELDHSFVTDAST